MSTHNGDAVSRRDILGLGALLGVALVVPLAGCTLEPTEHLTEQDMRLIGEVAEVIIPTTDTIGAKRAGVPEFARMMVMEWFAPEERRRFMRGLSDFDNDAILRFGAGFASLSAHQKEIMVGKHLQAAERRPHASGRPAKGDTMSPAGATAPQLPSKPPFILLMKRLTVLGYYTSEVGATQELELNIVPGQYLGCGPLDPKVHEGVSLGLRSPTFSAS